MPFNPAKTYVRIDRICVAHIKNHCTNKVTLSVHDMNTHRPVFGDGEVFNTMEESKEFAYACGYLKEFKRS